MDTSGYHLRDKQDHMKHALIWKHDFFLFNVSVVFTYLSDNYSVFIQNKIMSLLSTNYNLLDISHEFSFQPWLNLDSSILVVIAVRAQLEYTFICTEFRLRVLMKWEALRLGEILVELNAIITITKSLDSNENVNCFLSEFFSHLLN